MRVSFVAASTLLVIVPLIAASEGAPASWEASGNAEWVLLRVNLMPGQTVMLNYSVEASCVEHLQCFIQTAYHYARNPGGFAAATRSGGEFHVSVQAAQTRIVHEHLLPGNPIDIARGFQWDLTHDRYGDWFVLYLLMSEPSSYHLALSDAPALAALRTGTDGVEFRYAHEFGALLDVQARLGAGLDYTYQETTERGMIAVFDAWQGFIDLPRQASYQGPNGEHDSCLDTEVILISLGNCFAFVATGAPGAWEFDVVNKQGTDSGSDELWLIYLDEAPLA
jgi:hypothetical protein